jgi:hypothetical protein
VTPRCERQRCTGPGFGPCSQASGSEGWVHRAWLSQTGLRGPSRLRGDGINSVRGCRLCLPWPWEFRRPDRDAAVRAHARGRGRTTRERPHNSPSRITGPLPHCGPSRAPGNRVGDREPITDDGRVMWGLERAVGYNTSHDMWVIVVKDEFWVMSEVRSGRGVW